MPRDDSPDRRRRRDRQALFRRSLNCGATPVGYGFTAAPTALAPPTHHNQGGRALGPAIAA
jgi:hypothetical protein